MRDKAKPFVLRAGGAGTAILAIIIFAAIVGPIYESIKYPDPGYGNGMDFVVGGLVICIFAYFAYALFFLLSNRIKLTSTELAFTPPPWGYKLFPRIKLVRVKVKNIDSIFIGQLKTLEKMQENLKSKPLQDVLDIWHGKQSVGRGGSVPISVPLWPGAKFMPVIYVQLKEGRSCIISTKPFSKKGCVNLIRELRTLGIPVDTESSLRLDPVDLK